MTSEKSTGTADTPRRRRVGADFEFDMRRATYRDWNKLPPIQVIPDEQRTMPDTPDWIAEVFWHSHACSCRVCSTSAGGQLLKDYRAWELREQFIPASKSVPELPCLPERLLQAFGRAERSTQDRLHREHTEEPEWQPYDRGHLKILAILSEQSRTADSTATQDECQDSPDDPSGSPAGSEAA